MSEEQIQLIVDTDVGGDDLFCLSLLLSQPEKVRIHLISCVRGLRTDYKESVLRIRRMIKHFDYPYPVEVVSGDFEKKRHCFMEMDIVYKLHDEYFLGGNETYKKSWEDRLGFPHLEESETRVEYNNSVNRMSEYITKNPENFFTLLCIGPLVNISDLVKKNENILQKLQQVVIMGGGIEKSNTFFESKLANKTPATEWNWYCCPDSVKKLLDNIAKHPKKDKYLISTIEGSFSFPLVEGEFLFPTPELAKKEIFSLEKVKLNSKHHEVLKSLIFWNPISSLYDSVTAAHLLNPKIINTKRMSVDIHLEEGKEGSAVMKDLLVDEEEDGKPCCEVGYSFNEEEYILTLKCLFGIEN